MGLDPFETAILLVGGIGAALVVWLGRPALLSGGRGRLPLRFEVSALGRCRVPLDARQPLAYLSERLGRLGFTGADLPVSVPAGAGPGRRLLLVPFVHVEDRALFLMAIESRIVGPSQIMLHILTPLSGGRRIETSTLVGLEDVVRPPGVDVRVVLDVSTVEEIWSRHRLALTAHTRAEREPVEPADWRRHAAQAYEAWLEAALSARRLTLDPSGEGYLVGQDARRIG